MLDGLCFDREYKNSYSVEPATITLTRYLIKSDGTVVRPKFIFAARPVFYAFDLDDSKKESISISAGGQFHRRGISTNLNDR